jgi:uncharacterized membrane protein
VELARNLLLALHLIGMTGILISLILSRKNLSPGVTHSALLSLISGVALVGLRYPLVDANPTKWEEIDNLKISVKLLLVLTILIIGLKNRSKDSIGRNAVRVIFMLTLITITIAIL